jgi:hypothetical protein
MKKLMLVAGCCALFSLSFAAPLAATQNEKIILRSEPEPHPQIITVKTTLNGKVAYIPALIFPGDLVSDVKSQIAGALDIDEDSFYLAFNGVVLVEDQTLSSYGIGGGAILSLRYY